MKKTEPIGTLRFKDGTDVEVTGENNRYWLCQDGQFRKNNPAIEGFTPTSKKPRRSEPDFEALGEVKEDVSR